jgi:hypothetical protein
LYIVPSEQYANYSCDTLGASINYEEIEAGDYGMLDEGEPFLIEERQGKILLAYAFLFM